MNEVFDRGDDSAGIGRSPVGRLEISAVAVLTWSPSPK